jgi:glycosyltransferase involved in cell wall biosynthesis
MTAATRPTVTVTIPVLNEEAHIDACLDAVAAQSYREIVEVLVVDGGSTDATRDLVTRRAGNVRVVANPRRIQSAALNIALGEARGDVFVRVDGHCVIAPDYVERCVEALESSGAAMVGGAMNPQAQGWLQEGVAAAMTSPFGVGPARFHRGGPPSWVDTVYLGAYPTELARKVGGYREDVGVNEDAEFAIRMRPHGGVRFDPTIRSTYTPRGSLRAVIRQFYRYGRSRAATVRHHPKSIAPRQLAAPLFLVSLATPWRIKAAAAYAVVLVAAAAHQARRKPRAVAGLLLTLPAMHLPWAAGFWRGILRRGPQTVNDPTPAFGPGWPPAEDGASAAVG